MLLEGVGVGRGPGAERTVQQSITSVLAHVVVELLALGEAGATQVAPAALSTSVHPDVAVASRLVTKALAAEGALVWLLACVCSNVSLQVGVLDESLRTEWTRQSGTIMDQQVLTQTVTAQEGLVTDGAPDTVLLAVLLQLLGRVKALRAFVALVCMHPVHGTVVSHLVLIVRKVEVT